jgi:hypothetical protein
LPATTSDAGLAHLSNLKKLESLTFSPRTTDAGVRHIRGLTELRHVSFWGMPQITDEALPHLQLLSKLESLNLWKTSVTDAGLTHLDKLNLEQLILNDNISDAGIVHLLKLKSLVHLNILKSKISPAGHALLKQGLPNCDIAHPATRGGRIGRGELGSE